MATAKVKLDGRGKKISGKLQNREEEGAGEEGEERLVSVNKAGGHVRVARSKTVKGEKYKVSSLKGKVEKAMLLLRTDDEVLPAAGDTLIYNHSSEPRVLQLTVLTAGSKGQFAVFVKPG